MKSCRSHDDDGLHSEAMARKARGYIAAGYDGAAAIALHASMTRLVRVAMGRIGGQLPPWLDEGLLMGQGLATLLQLSDGCADPLTPGDETRESERTLRRVVGSMRHWARASSWFARAWPCRIAPLCASLTSHGSEREEVVAEDLGLKLPELAERYTEAGLVFGVSPELMLPEMAIERAGMGISHRSCAPGSALLAEAISGRPVEQRRVLTLYFQEKLSFPEIGELLQLTPAGVQQLYGRAATSIRSRLISEPSRTTGAGG